MAISAAKQAFLDALAGVKQKIDTGDDTFSEITGCKFYTPQNARRLINVYAINFIP